MVRKLLFGTAIVRKFPGVVSPSCLGLYLATIACATPFFLVSLPDIEAFCLDTPGVETSAVSFPLTSGLGMALLSLIAVVGCIRRNPRSQLMEMLLFISGPVVMVTPLLTGKYIMMAYADMNGYRLQDVQEDPTDRHPITRYIFTKR